MKKTRTFYPLNMQYADPIPSRMIGLLCTFLTLLALPGWSQINVTLQVQHIKCGGFSTGIITAIPSGGTSPYTYLWSNGSTSNPVTNLAAGSYTVTVTDINGLTGTKSTSVTQPPPLEVDIEVTDCGLPGAMTGNVMGGTPPINYLWSTGATTPGINDLSPGQYCLTVTDANACAFFLCKSIGTPLIVEISTSPAVCGSGMGGSASVNVGGGVSPYTYLWNNGETTANITNLPPGNYSVTVTADNGCTETQNGTVGLAPGNFPIAMNLTFPTCLGSNTGSITASASGGVAPYNYQWNTGASGATVNNLPAGTFMVTATDALGCTSTQTTSLSYQSQLTVTTNGFDPTCAGVNNGSIASVPQNGITPYQFLWNNGDTNQVAANLGPGIYTLTVTDDLNCTASASDTLVAPPVFSVNLTATNVSQCGASDGSLSATPSGGGNPPFNYLWSNGSTNPMLENLAAGTYTVTITSSQGCTASASKTITQPLNLDIDIDGTTLVCGNDDDGTLTADPTYGNPPYIYDWNNGGNTQTIQNLPSGSYTVTVTSVEGCTGTDAYTIQGNPEIVINETIKSVSCFGISDGSILINLTGGSPPLDVLWNNGSNSTILNNLFAGDYTLTVTDNIGCSKIQTYTVDEPDAINILFTNSSGSCDNNGFSSTSVSGGTMPYSYLWNTGDTTNAIFGIAAGDYFITVVDANGCSAQSATTINPYPDVTLQVNALNTTCNGTTDGTASASTSGGTPPLSYQWSNGDTTQTITGLNPGLFIVTVTDINGCTAVSSDTVFLGDGLNVSIDAPAFVCPGTFESATVNAMGGDPDYTYTWSNGQETQTATDLGPGTYSVTVTDPTGCSGIASTTLSPGGGFSVNFSFENVDCFGAETGSISLDVTNGLPPYTFLWNTGDTLSSLDSLVAGTYSVTVADSSECSNSQDIIIQEPPELELSLDALDGTCGNNGLITSTLSGGIPPYSYNWSNGSMSPNINDLAGDTYLLTVTDLNNCTIVDSAEVDIIPQPVCSIELTHPISTLDGMDGELTAVVDGGTPPFTFEWNDGQNTETAVNLSPNTYVVTVTDANNCLTICNFTLLGPGQLGDFVWLDDNENGIQDDNEMGMEEVQIELSGINAYGENVDISTLSDGAGNYAFVVPPGTYKITFQAPNGFVPSPKDEGADDNVDSDASQLTNTTIAYSLGSGEVISNIDAGFYMAPPCDNVTSAGSICCDQSLCGPGLPADPVTNAGMPSGGSGDLEFLWMFSTEPIPFDPNTWTPLEDAIDPDYAPGLMTQTTNFVRTVRRQGCIEFLVTDPVRIEVDSIAVADISGPDEICVTLPNTFSAADNGTGASYQWNFEDAIPSDADTRVAEDISWDSFGEKTVALGVEKNGCTSRDTLVVNISNLPAACGNALIIQAAELAGNKILVDWFYEVSDTVDRTYLVQWAWENEPFIPIGPPDSVMQQGSLAHYFMTHHEPRRGRNFYRVILSDSEGAIVNSNTVEIRLIGEFTLVHAYPNPFNDFIRVEIIERFGVPITLEMYNVFGQLVSEIQVEEDATLFDITTWHLSTGSYYLLVKYDRKPQKILKLVKFE